MKFKMQLLFALATSKYFIATRGQWLPCWRAQIQDISSIAQSSKDITITSRVPSRPFAVNPYPQSSGNPCSDFVFIIDYFSLF